MMHEAPATPRRKSASSDELDYADANKYDDLEEAQALLAAESGEKIKKKAPPRNLFGFYLQYFAVGVVYGGLPSTIYGFFLGYLNVEGYVYATCATIVGLPWSFKFIFGAINDCFPILGYRRKPYMVIGWCLCSLALIRLATMQLPEPYWCVNETDTSYVREENGLAATACNEEAKHLGGKFAFWMMLASLGYCVADVAADGLMVALARAEPVQSRGTTQTSVYMVRTFGNVVAVLTVGLCMNSWRYNGSFSWGLSYSNIMALFSIPAIIMIPVSWCCVSETQVIFVNKRMRKACSFVSRDADDCGGVAYEARRTVPEYCAQVWELLRGKPMLYVVLFQFLTPFIGNIWTTAGGEVKTLQNACFSVVGLALFAGGLQLVKKYFLHSSWRWMLALTTIFLNFIDMPFTFLTIFNVVRNQYFYLGETVLTCVEINHCVGCAMTRPPWLGRAARNRHRHAIEQVLTEIPAAANFVIATYVIVEMAEGGDEGIVYGLLTTTANLGSPFAQAISNQLFGLWRPSLSDSSNYIDDTPEFRRMVFYSFLLSYLFAFLSLCTLPLLPSQRAEAQARKKAWDKSDAYAWTSVVLISVGLVYSVTINFLAMFPATMCLRIAGGNGCG